MYILCNHDKIFTIDFFGFFFTGMFLDETGNSKLDIYYILYKQESAAIYKNKHLVTKCFSKTHHCYNVCIVV